MDSLNRALYAFWAGFGLPAYISGQVPDGASFPYLTFDVEEGTFLGKTVLTAHAWYRRENQGENINKQRAELLDKVKAALPAILQLDGGGAVLWPNDAGFLSYVGDPTDERISGGRISYQINYYST